MWFGQQKTFTGEGVEEGWGKRLHVPISLSSIIIIIIIILCRRYKGVIEG